MNTHQLGTLFLLLVTCPAQLGDVRKCRSIDISPLKRFVETRLPLGSVTRSVIMGEPDTMSVEEFIARVPTWLRVLAHDTRCR